MLNAGSVIGAFSVRLGLDSNDYAAGILAAQGLNEVFGSSVATFMANPLLGVINIAKNLGASLISTSGRLLETAEEVERLGDRVGATTDLVQALAARMEEAGFGSDKAELGLRTLNRRLGEARNGLPEAAKLFEQLGISVEEVGNTDEALSLVLEAIDALSSSAEKAAFAARLLGDEAGTKLVNAVGGGTQALEEMIAQKRALGQVIDGDVVASLARANTRLAEMEQGLGGVRDVVLSNFLAGFFDEFDDGEANIDNITDKVINLLGPAAKQLGEDAAGLVPALRDISLELENIVNKLGELEGFAENPIGATGRAAAQGALGDRLGDFIFERLSFNFQGGPIGFARRRLFSDSGDEEVLLP